MSRFGTRMAARQAAVTEFGRFALESRDLAAITERALDVVTVALGAPIGSVIRQLRGTDRFAVVAARGGGLPPGQEFTVPSELERQHADTGALVVPDWRCETRYRPGGVSQAVGALASISVPLLVEGRPWGRLQALYRQPRTISGTDVDAVQSVAHALASAIARDRVERTHAAISAFGRFALESWDIAATVERALDLATEALDAPLGSVIKRLREPARFLVLARHGDLGLSPGEEFTVPPEFDRLHAGAGPLVVADWDTEEGQPPLAASRAAGVLATLSVPLLVEGGPWGRLGVSFLQPRHFADADVDVIQSLAHMLASALERDRVEQAHATLAAFGRFALASRDITATLDRAVEVVTGMLDAPMGTVMELTGEGTRFVVTAGRGMPPALVGQEIEAPPVLLDLHRGDQPFAVSDWREHPASSQVQAMLALGVVASVSAPLMVAGRPWGRLVTYLPQPYQFSSTDVDMIQSVAHLLAAAVERDRTERRLRETAQAFQRALLPARLPEITGIETAVRYLPAHGHQVGGDWYDVLTLPDGGIGVVMGDVEGHDSTAAAVMGQVRTALRAQLVEGHTPAEVMDRVNQFVIRHTDRLVTCCYAELRPNDLTLTGVTAAHPPPWVVSADGTIRPLALAPGPLLGLDPRSSYTEQTVVLPPGCTLLLVTDGLVDDVAGAVHVGSEAFVAVAGANAALPVERLADVLVTPSPTAPAQRDDAAVLVVRLTSGAPLGPLGPLGPDRQAQRLLRPVPESAPTARRFVSDILANWRLSEIEDSAALAVSELVTNSVLHTTSPIRLTLRRLGGQGLWLGVHDDSDRFVRRCQATEDDISGRGLSIVETLADSWGIEPNPDGSGKTVWLELGTPPGPCRPVR